MRPHLIAGLLFCSLGLAQEQPRTFRVPFHTAGSVILLDATVNDKPAVLLLNTGANNTIVSPQAANPNMAGIRQVSLESER